MPVGAGSRVTQGDILVTTHRRMSGFEQNVISSRPEKKKQNNNIIKNIIKARGMPNRTGSNFLIAWLARRPCRCAAARPRPSEK